MDAFDGLALAAGPSSRAATESVDALSRDRAQRLMDATLGQSLDRRRRRVALVLLYLCGLKAGEAIALDVTDVDLPGACLEVDRHGPHRRLLPLVPAAATALDRWLSSSGRHRVAQGLGALLVNRRGGRLSRQGLWLIVRGAAIDAGIEDAVSSNDLRRACGAHLAALGLEQAAIEALLGQGRGAVPSASILARVGWGAE